MPSSSTSSSRHGRRIPPPPKLYRDRGVLRVSASSSREGGTRRSVAAVGAKSSHQRTEASSTRGRSRAFIEPEKRHLALCNNFIHGKACSHQQSRSGSRKHAGCAYAHSLKELISGHAKAGIPVAPDKLKQARALELRDNQRNGVRNTVPRKKMMAPPAKPKPKPAAKLPRSHTAVSSSTTSGTSTGTTSSSTSSSSNTSTGSISGSSTGTSIGNTSSVTMPTIPTARQPAFTTASQEIAPALERTASTDDSSSESGLLVSPPTTPVNEPISSPATVKFTGDPQQRDDAAPAAAGATIRPRPVRLAADGQYESFENEALRTENEVLRTENETLRTENEALQKIHRQQSAEQPSSDGNLVLQRLEEVTKRTGDSAEDEPFDLDNGEIDQLAFMCDWDATLGFESAKVCLCESRLVTNYLTESAPDLKLYIDESLYDDTSSSDSGDSESESSAESPRSPSSMALSAAAAPFQQPLVLPPMTRCYPTAQQHVEMQMPQQQQQPSQQPPLFLGLWPESEYYFD